MADMAEPKSFKEKIAELTEQELEKLRESYPSAGAGPQDDLADAVDQRLAELRNQTI